MTATHPTDKLDEFFKEVKAITFWTRLFRWKQFQALSYDAYGELANFKTSASQKAQELESLGHDHSILKANHDHVLANEQRLGREFAATSAKLNEVEREKSDLVKENVLFKQTDDARRVDYENKIAGVNALNDSIKADRQKEILDSHNQEIARLANLHETWNRHQDSVQEAIKGICKRHAIDYVDKVPFKGSPDNTIKVCDEYVIFDAKSPASDDLGNFFGYIKTQTEAAKKYAREEGVKKDVFLVVPSNTVEVIEQFCFDLANYKVYVVTIDVLEPLILNLRKMEDYEFVDQLSPEERENICRVIGRFAHMTKRRIQIDQFFERQFLEILFKCDADLPADIVQKVGEFERAEKLNPPIEKRAKLISTKVLQTDGEQIRREAEGKGIAVAPAIQQAIKSAPLYLQDDLNSERVESEAGA